MDRVATRTDPLTRDESFEYDVNGNLTKWTDRKGQVTIYQYDALDRQTFVGFGATGTPPSYSYASTITTTFEAGDRATDIVDSIAGTIERTYDLLDRLTEEVTPEGTVSYTYDDAGRRASMTVAGQTPLSYTFDDADRLTGITQGSAAVGMAYDNGGRRTSLTLPNGIVIEYAYDDDSRLTGLTYKQGLSTLGTLTYTYDADGKRATVGGTWARTNLPAALASATYDDANQIATFGGTTFTYDDNGHLTSDGVRSYTWDARDQLTSLTGPVNASFAYDAIGRRRSKTVGGTTTQFLYDRLNPVQELSGATPTANLLTGLGIDEFFTRTDSNGVRNYLTDALASSVALADGAGTIQTEYTYDPSGGPTTSGAGTSSAIAFTGREADGTGLYFYRARYYDPRLQRFIAEDPSGFYGGLNGHIYAAARPTMLVDPLGLKPAPIFGAGGGSGNGGDGSGAGGRGRGAGGGRGRGGRPPRSGRGPGGDKWWGHNDRDFQDWYHRKWKQGGDATQEEMDEAYKEWEKQGKPKRDPREDWDRTKRDPKLEPTDLADWLANHPEVVVGVGVVVVGGAVVFFTGGTGVWIFGFAF
jgi:RHS repeat-associated protein